MHPLIGMDLCHTRTLTLTSSFMRVTSPSSNCEHYPFLYSLYLFFFSFWSCHFIIKRKENCTHAIGRTFSVCLATRLVLKYGCTLGTRLDQYDVNMCCSHFPGLVLQTTQVKRLQAFLVSSPVWNKTKSTSKCLGTTGSLARMHCIFIPFTD